ncbi:MAG: DNA (cytosine-5-)-methyltransferase [Bacillota bacterium]|nr:DNA (cytosine-5-)-methyltransferase [Bacillota bacterium]
MQGGQRVNAGRKAISKLDKKEGYKIYLTRYQKEEIDLYGIGNSFSERCLNLLNQAIGEEKKDSDRSVKVIDLFAGLGGIRLGFEQGLKASGYKTKCVFASEIKKYAIDAYQGFFGNEKVYGDITQISSDFIPDFDFLLAGFPCQPFSSAGNRRGFSDTRGTLFFEIERILKDKIEKGVPAKGFLLENVEGLINHNNGDTLNVILKHLKDIGYEVNYKLIDSQYFGLAQSRKRVYIVGMLSSLINLDDFNKKTAVLESVLDEGLPTIDSKFTRQLFKHYSPEAVVGKSIKDKRGGENNIHSWDIGLKGEVTKIEKDLLNMLLKERRKKKWAEEIGIKWMDGMPLTESQIRTFFDKEELTEILEDLTEKGYLTLEYPKKLVDGRRVPDETKPIGYNIVAGKLSFEFSQILDPKQLAPTLVAMDVDKLGIVDGKGLRKLTVKEGQLLCGYPENYDLSMISNKEAFDLLGNTVCVPVIRAIAERIGAELRRESDAINR